MDDGGGYMYNALAMMPQSGGGGGGSKSKKEVERKQNLQGMLLSLAPLSMDDRKSLQPIQVKQFVFLLEMLINCADLRPNVSKDKDTLIKRLAANPLVQLFEFDAQTSLDDILTAEPKLSNAFGQNNAVYRKGSLEWMEGQGLEVIYVFRASDRQYKIAALQEASKVSVEHGYSMDSLIQSADPEAPFRMLWPTSKFPTEMEDQASTDPRQTVQSLFFIRSLVVRISPDKEMTGELTFSPILRSPAVSSASSREEGLESRLELAGKDWNDAMCILLPDSIREPTEFLSDADFKLQSVVNHFHSIIDDLQAQMRKLEEMYSQNIFTMLNQLLIKFEPEVKEAELFMEEFKHLEQKEDRTVEEDRRFRQMKQIRNVPQKDKSEEERIKRYKKETEEARTEDQKAALANKRVLEKLQEKLMHQVFDSILSSRLQYVVAILGRLSESKKIYEVVEDLVTGFIEDIYALNSSPSAERKEEPRRPEERKRPAAPEVDFFDLGAAEESEAEAVRTSYRAPKLADCQSGRCSHKSHTVVGSLRIPLPSSSSSSSSSFSSLSASSSSSASSKSAVSAASKPASASSSSARGKIVQASESEAERKRKPPSAALRDFGYRPVALSQIGRPAASPALVSFGTPAPAVAAAAVTPRTGFLGVGKS